MFYPSVYKPILKAAPSQDSCETGPNIQHLTCTVEQLITNSVKCVSSVRIKSSKKKKNCNRPITVSFSSGHVTCFPFTSAIVSSHNNNSEWSYFPVMFSMSLMLRWSCFYGFLGCCGPHNVTTGDTVRQWTNVLENIYEKRQQMKRALGLYSSIKLLCNVRAAYILSACPSVRVSYRSCTSSLSKHKKLLDKTLKRREDVGSWRERKKACDLQVLYIVTK